MKKKELKEFIDEIVDYIEHDIANCEKTSKDEYLFSLERWSEEQPYWCVFSCKYVDGALCIDGHYCLDEQANFHEVLSVLADSGIQVRVQSGYFADAINVLPVAQTG